MMYNRLMIGFFAVYILKVPLAIVLYANSNYYGLIALFVGSFIAEIVLFYLANAQPFGE